MAAIILPPDSSSAQLSTLHVVDQAIYDIAQQFRFTTEEVKEYYDKCGDINRTTNRFRKMRQVLTNLPDDDDDEVPLPPLMSITNDPSKAEPSVVSLSG